MMVFFVGGDPNGDYVTAVWGFMSFKWSLFAILSSRTYRKKYEAMSGESTGIVNS